MSLTDYIKKNFGYGGKKTTAPEQSTNTDLEQAKEDVVENNSSNIPKDVMLGSGVSMNLDPTQYRLPNETPEAFYSRINSQQDKTRQQNEPLLRLLANTPTGTIDPNIYQFNNDPVLQGMTPVGGTQIGIFGYQPKYPWAAYDMRKQSMLQAMMMKKAQEEQQNAYPSLESPQTYHAYQNSLNEKYLGALNQVISDVNNLPEKDREMAMMQIKQAPWNPNTEWGKKIYNITSSYDQYAKQGIQLAKNAKDVINSNSPQKEKDIASMVLNQNFDPTSDDAVSMAQFLYKRPALIQTVKDVTDGLDLDIKAVLQNDPLYKEEYIKNPYGTIVRFMNEHKGMIDERIDKFVDTWKKDNNWQTYFPGSKDEAEATTRLKEMVKSRFADQMDMQSSVIWDHKTNVNVNFDQKDANWFQEVGTEVKNSYPKIVERIDDNIAKLDAGTTPENVWQPSGERIQRITNRIAATMADELRTITRLQIIAPTNPKPTDKIEFPLTSGTLPQAFQKPQQITLDQAIRNYSLNVLDHDKDGNVIPDIILKELIKAKEKYKGDKLLDVVATSASVAPVGLSSGLNYSYKDIATGVDRLANTKLAYKVHYTLIPKKIPTGLFSVSTKNEIESFSVPMFYDFNNQTDILNWNTQSGSNDYGVQYDKSVLPVLNK